MIRGKAVAEGHQIAPAQGQSTLFTRRMRPVAVGVRRQWVITINGAMVAMDRGHSDMILDGEFA